MNCDVFLINQADAEVLLPLIQTHGGTSSTDGKEMEDGDMLYLAGAFRVTPSIVDQIKINLGPLIVAPVFERFDDRALWRENQRAHGAYRCWSAAGRRIRRDVRPSKADARRLARKRWLQKLRTAS